MTRHLGTDILLNGDWEVQPTGDAALTSEEACLLQDIRHRLMTPKGSLWTHPDYGLDYYRYLNTEDSLLERLDLEQAIEIEVGKDPRVVPGSVKASVIKWTLEKITVEVKFSEVRNNNPMNLILPIGGELDNES